MVALENIARPLLRQAQDDSIALSPGLVAELDSLTHETDSELFYGDLLRLGRRFQDRDRHDWALKLYATVAEQTEFPELAKKAQTSIAALEGRGEIGARAELLVSRFVKDVRDPATIVPMLAGTTIAGLVRGAGLGALAGRSASWYSRGVGARFTAGSLAFAAEVPTFVATGRALRGGNSPNTWSHDLQSGTLSLGAIKLFSLAGKQGLAQLHGVNEWGVITRGAAFARYGHPLVHQASLFGGLMAAHRTETKLGLRPQVDDATTVIDTLASMISLGAGMRLGTGLLGRGYARQMRELEWRTQSSIRAQDLAAFPIPKIPAKALGFTAGLALTLGAREAWAGGEVVQMSSGIEILIEIILLGGFPAGIGILKALLSSKDKAPEGLIDLAAEARIMNGMIEKTPSLSPQELRNAAIYANGFLEHRIPRAETQTALAAIDLLGAVLPRMEPGTGIAYMRNLLRVIQNDALEFQPRSLRTFKAGLPSLSAYQRSNLLLSALKSLSAATDQNVLPGYFMAIEIASGLDASERRVEAQRLIGHLATNKKLIDVLALYLRKKQVPLMWFRAWLGDLEGKMIAGEKNRAEPKGLAAFRQTLSNLWGRAPEPTSMDLIRKFKTESKVPGFDLEASLLEVQILQELMGKPQPYLLSEAPAGQPLWETLRQPALRDYLDATEVYFEPFTTDSLRRRILDRVLPEAGYRDPALPEED